MPEIKPDLGLEDFIRGGNLNVEERNVNGFTILRSTRPQDSIYSSDIYQDIVLNPNGGIVGVKRYDFRDRVYNIGIIGEQIIGYLSGLPKGKTDFYRMCDFFLVGMVEEVEDISQLISSYSTFPDPKSIHIDYRRLPINSSTFNIETAYIYSSDGEEDLILCYENDKGNTAAKKPNEPNPILAYNPQNDEFEYSFETSSGLNTVRFRKSIQIDEHLKMRELMATDLEWLNLPRLFPLLKLSTQLQPDNYQTNQ
ncbi:MAG: hypothetical protein IH934_04970 [Nanoarchaeota archaeon]|nr:hypothetical protein [Nanoarchaeota archaeon]